MRAMGWIVDEGARAPSAAVTRRGPRTLSWYLLPAIVGVAQVIASLRGGLRGDLRVHLRFAEDLALTATSASPYPLFSELTIIVRALIPFDLITLFVPSIGERQTTWVVAGAVVLFVAAAATAVLVRARLAQPDLRATSSGRRQLALVTIGVLFLGPVTVLTWSRHQLRGAYLTSTAFENATYLLLKPTALLAFVLLVENLPGGPSGRVSTRICAVTAAASVLVLTAKPSYTVCVLPAVMVVALIRRFASRRVDWRFLALGFVAPSIVVLLVQLAIVSSDSLGSIELNPLATVQRLFDHISLGLGWLPVMLVLSMAFPLATALVHWRAASRSVSLQVAWIAMSIGLLLFLLLEVRGRPDYGELAGGPQIGIFLLNVESARILLQPKQLQAWRDRRVLSSVPWVLFAIQAFCGGMFWLLEILQPLRWY